MKSFEERLEQETNAWVGEGLVTAEQRARLLARHPVTSTGPQRFLAVVGMIGGALLIVGVSLVIKANWERIHDWVKIGGLVALLVGTYGAGWRLREADGGYPRLGEALLVAGAVFFLLGLALVSQIYHLDGRASNLVLVWWAGIIALPWLTRGAGLQLVSCVAGLVWLAMELGAPDSWIRLLDRGAESAGAWLPLFASAIFVVGLALHFFGSGLRAGSFRGFSHLHEVLGLLLAMAALYLLGFAWSAHNVSAFGQVHAARQAPVAVLMTLAGGVGVWAWRRDCVGLNALAPYLSVGIVPVLANLLGVGSHGSNWLWGGIACLALFVLNLGMIRVGLATMREDWINLGIGGIALNIVTRYFVLFGTMLEGGLFFIVTGVLVLGLGLYLERKRRAFVANVRKEAGS